MPNPQSHLQSFSNPAAPSPPAPAPHAAHQRAVSYVRHVSGRQLVTASTDSTLRLWDIGGFSSSGGGPGAAGSAAGGAAAEGDPAGGGAGPGQGPQQPVCALTYRGHVNERNFVGLSVSSEGYVVCGSETNELYCFYKVGDAGKGEGGCW